MSHIIEIVGAPQGIQLPASYQGAKGDKGDTGDKGDPGNSGPAGATGTKGDKGEKGDQGAQGIQGNQGPAGATGTKGDRGEKGDQGAQGIQGNQGTAGATGAKGDRGEKGDQGIQGVKGDKGDAGETGPQGAKGDKGDMGIQGIKGETGPIGSTGAKGEKGDIGDITPELRQMSDDIHTQAQTVHQETSVATEMASDAIGAKNEATSQATIATTKATEAATSATNAQGSAASALQSRNSASTSAQTALDAAGAVIVGMGGYNATTNVATITETGATFTPTTVANQTNGKFFDVTVAGTSSITGVSLNWLVGDKLISRGTKWDRIPATDTGYQKVTRIEETIKPNIYSVFNPILDSDRKLLLGFEGDGGLYVAKYKDASISGAALKSDTVDSAQLTPAVRAAIAAGGNVVIPDNSIAQAKFTAALLNTLWPYYGKKLVTLGDSITAGVTWQPLLAQLTGLIWSETETKLGLNGNPKMGVGGSKIVPEINTATSGRSPGDSIYYRAGYAHLYSPDIIILFGGQNDSTSSAVATLGTITDAPYTGDEIISGQGTLPTFYAAYKGTLLKLLTNNPNAKIYAMTRMWNNVGDTYFTEAIFNATMNINTAIKTICARYSVQVIDLHQEIGITPYNASVFYSDNVHPNAAGGERMARLIASKLN